MTWLNPRVRKIVDWIVGLALIAVGIVGWILPVLPGWAFVIMGLAVLSSHSRWAHALLERLKRAGQGVRRRVGAGVEKRRAARDRTRRSYD